DIAHQSTVEVSERIGEQRCACFAGLPRYRRELVDRASRLRAEVLRERPLLHAQHTDGEYAASAEKAVRLVLRVHTDGHKQRRKRDLHDRTGSKGIPAIAVRHADYIDASRPIAEQFCNVFAHGASSSLGSPSREWSARC